VWTLSFVEVRGSWNPDLNGKLQARDYLEDLNFKKLYGDDEGPDLGNASEFHKLICIDVPCELSSGYMFCS